MCGSHSSLPVLPVPVPGPAGGPGSSLLAGADSLALVGGVSPRPPTSASSGGERCFPPCSPLSGLPAEALCRSAGKGGAPCSAISIWNALLGTRRASCLVTSRIFARATSRSWGEPQSELDSFRRCCARWRSSVHQGLDLHQLASSSVGASATGSPCGPADAWPVSLVWWDGAAASWAARLCCDPNRAMSKIASTALRSSGETPPPPPPPPFPLHFMPP